MSYPIGAAILKRFWSAIGLLNPIALINSYWDRKTTRRYASGGIQLIEKALNQDRLERAVEIISEASKCADSPSSWLLSVFNRCNEDYSALVDTFQHLDQVCAAFKDDASPPKVKESATRQILTFLSRPTIRSFVDANQQRFPELWEFAKRQIIIA